MDNYPNFFIIGAPKCGTTAMSEYLRTHPNVVMSSIKEPLFFSPELIAKPKVRNLDEYLALFQGVTAETKIVGEASPVYIHSDLALPKLRSFRPDARLLVMLRRPTDLVYSYHGELLKSGQELEFNFETAWELQSARQEGKHCPPGTPPAILQYRWIGSLGSQVQRVLENFPKRQIHFIIFDDLVKDTRLEYVRLLEFLGIPYDGRIDFPKKREGIQFKSQALAWFPRYMKAKTRPCAEVVKKVFGIQRLGILPAFDRFNAKVESRRPLRPEFRRYLDDAFRSEVILLEKLIGRDLSAWRSDQLKKQDGFETFPSEPLSKNASA